MQLRLRLRNGREGSSKYLILKGVRLVYGEETIRSALPTGQIVTAQTQTGKSAYQREESAASPHFVRDRKR
ncbi:hypothetical protein MPNT_230040 [Candidatus Methylacidithermus pantelleriae]|uniref:Uncharacterized protein n=1 Tax=Candidatus Methylacidithermus pantelleriae TaxID=2744239 RepID=A0A8J2BQ00_9BACT|nr:hypothetical protein MPNT_230040 [Candidatus Methylacidithermus pantelleriae]